MDINKPPSQVLTIDTLGTFSVRAGNHTLSDNSPRAGQIWKLFKYIITNRSMPIPTDKLADLLWENEDIDNPIKALYTLVYRLRTILNQHFDEKQDFILFQHNTYIWNKNASYRLDAELFESCVKQASAPDLENKERIALLTQAFELYRGNYLSESSSENWAIPPINYYKRMYTNVILQLAKYCAEDNDYASIVHFCERAIELDPYEENLHYTLIYALSRLGQLSQALAHYDYISAMLYNELGLQPSENLQKLYGAIHKQFEEDLPADLLTIRDSLREDGEEKTAFYCDIDTFKYIYQLQMRAMQRSGNSMFISLITILSPEGTLPEEKTLMASAAFLKNTVLAGLRRGDVVTQPSKAQLLILLPSTTEETCDMVMNRLVEKFKSTYTGKAVRVRYTFEQMSPQDAAAPAIK